MTWNTPYLGTPRGVVTQTSGATTVLSDLSVAGTLDAGVIDVAGALTATGTITGSGTIAGVRGSYTSVSIATLPSSGVTLGTSTVADALWITLSTSGLSLGIKSNGTLYWINSTVSSP